MGRDSEDSLAVVVYREDGVWQSGVLPERVTDDLDGLIAVAPPAAGRERRRSALVNVADEFFVAVRVRGEEVRLLLSDVTAAVAWDLARQVVDRLGIPHPVRTTSRTSGPPATCRSSVISGSTRWSWAPCWPTSTRTPMRCSSPLLRVSASPTFTTAPSRQRHLSDRTLSDPDRSRGDSVLLRSCVGPPGGDWVGTEVDLADVEDLDGVVDVLRQAVGDDTEVAVLLFEENDEWFGIVRIDEDADPRVFVSDGRVVETSAIGAILGEAAADAGRRGRRRR